MGEKYSVYQWRYYSPIRNKWMTTRYKTTLEQILKEHPEAEPVAGTEEIREVPDDLFANSMGRFNSGFPGNE